MEVFLEHEPDAGESDLDLSVHYLGITRQSSYGFLILTFIVFQIV